MTTYKPAEILKELNSLITYSCSTKNEDDEVIQSLHIAIIKKYFGAHKVSFDEQENLIHVQVPIGENEFTNITMECQDRERFLKSCIQEDPTSLSFYQNMLIYYNVEKNFA